MDLIRESRSIDRDAHLTHEFRSLESFTQRPTVRDGIYTLWDGGLPIDFHVRARSSPVLVVVLHGARTKREQLPWLVGSGVVSLANASRISFSDPSLYLAEDLRLTWHTESVHQPTLPELMALVVQHMAQALNVEKVVIFGASGGGFAALNLGSLVPGSTVVAVNPQTRIAAYQPAIVNRWREVCWAGRSLEEIAKLCRTDMVELYAQPQPSHVLYLQNRSDAHTERHFAPFVEAAQPLSLQVQLGEWGDGHVPPPKSALEEMVAQVAALPTGAPLTGFEWVRGAPATEAPRTGTPATEVPRTGTPSTGSPPTEVGSSV